MSVVPNPSGCCGGDLCDCPTEECDANPQIMITVNSPCLGLSDWEEQHDCSDVGSPGTADIVINGDGCIGAVEYGALFLEFRCIDQEFFVDWDLTIGECMDSGSESLFVNCSPFFASASWSIGCCCQAGDATVTLTAAEM